MVFSAPESKTAHRYAGPAARPMSLLRLTWRYVASAMEGTEVRLLYQIGMVGELGVVRYYFNLRKWSTPIVPNWDGGRTSSKF